jgi:hypothetical protein
MRQSTGSMVGQTLESVPRYPAKPRRIPVIPQECLRENHGLFQIYPLMNHRTCTPGYSFVVADRVPQRGDFPAIVLHLK